MSRSGNSSKRPAPAEAQEAAWIADEDRFVLRQAKKKAIMRVKGGRAQPVDWLAVTLVVIDPVHNDLDDEVDHGDLELVAPESVLEPLDDAQMVELEKGIGTYLTLEHSRSNQDYWNMMKTICGERRKLARSGNPTARGVSSVAGDLNKILGPKNLEELEKLEKQIASKLASNDPIDTDYWEHLMSSLLTYKAKARLRKVSQAILDSRLASLRRQHAAEAPALTSQLSGQIVDAIEGEHEQAERSSIHLDATIGASGNGLEPVAKRRRIGEDESSSSIASAFDREVARGLGENEEVFTTEEDVTTKNTAQWSGKHRPRKPKHFNRVHTGYEWNKYNQTHYDHDNPPPKVVQGYKFNVFYPDLIDKTKAPTYKIERENGRRRGQSFTAAGEDDTCLIRFVAGPPYEDIAFRIVDKEWDYSAKRDRGFRSTFDKGILQLHFQFKKIYYRK